MVVVKHTAVDATDCCQALPVIQGKLDACNVKVTLHVGDAGYRLEGAVGGKMGVCVPEGTPLTGQQCLSGESLTIKMTKVCVHLYNCCGVNRKGRIRAVPKNQMDRAERIPPDDMLTHRRGHRMMLLIFVHVYGCAIKLSQIMIVCL